MLSGRVLVLWSACFVLGSVDPAAGGELPWDLAALSESPQTFPAPEFHEDGVTAVFYEGLPYKGKPTRAFAWYGIPEVKAGEKCPAMVLVHGGGGTAFAEWVRLWVGRGYAAIAMDTCGCVPKGKYGDWQRHDAGGPAGWGAFDRIDDPISDQWTYHAVADVVLAHSLIRSFPEVDPERIGITGISWGGYLTCIAAGVDPRFKLAVPVYGCGFLGENSVWLDDFKKMGPEKAAQWLGQWDPSVYLPRAAVPMLWVTGTNDFAYPMDSLQKSYRLPTGPRTLCLRLRMPHGHGGAGENPEEIHAFAESILNGKTPLAAITGQGCDGSEVWVTFTAKAPIAKAELNYTRDTGKWQDRQWESAPARLDAAQGRVTATLPEGTAVYYVNLIDDRDLVVSSEHVDLSCGAGVAATPQIKVEPGEIKRVCKRGIDDTPSQVSFTVTNTGGASLHIDRLTASCGCSQPRAEQSDVPPGASTRVVVDLDANVYKHDKAAVVHVFTNAPGQPSVAVPISVRWLEPTAMEPQGGILSLGRILRGETGRVEGVLSQQFGDEPLAVKEIRCNPDLFTVEPIFDQEDGRTRLRLRVQLKPQTVAGAFDEVLEVVSNAASSPHTFHVVGTVEGALVVAPQRLTLTRVAAGSKTERTFIVTPRPPGQRRLDKVVPSTPALVAEPTEQDGRWRIKLTYTAPAQSGPICEYLDFIDDGGGITRVPCKGSVFAPFVAPSPTP